MIFLVAAALVAVVAVAGSDTTNALVATINGVLPNGWIVSSSTNAVPYNLSIQPGRPKGTCLTFLGSVMVRGPRGINPEKESFVVWVMPADYVPTEPETVAQFEEARLLGSNTTMRVYWKTFTTETPSWENWQSDLIQKFEIKTTIVQPNGAPPTQPDWAVARRNLHIKPEDCHKAPVPDNRGARPSESITEGDTISLQHGEWFYTWRLESVNGTNIVLKPIEAKRTK